MDEKEAEEDYKGGQGRAYQQHGGGRDRGGGYEEEEKEEMGEERGRWQGSREYQGREAEDYEDYEKEDEDDYEEEEEEDYNAQAGGARAGGAQAVVMDLREVLMARKSRDLAGGGKARTHAHKHVPIRAPTKASGKKQGRGQAKTWHATAAGSEAGAKPVQGPSKYARPGLGKSCAGAKERNPMPTPETVTCAAQLGSQELNPMPIPAGAQEQNPMPPLKNAQPWPNTMNLEDEPHWGMHNRSTQAARPSPSQN
eukprot:gene26975-34990_t